MDSITLNIKSYANVLISCEQHADWEKEGKHCTEHSVVLILQSFKKNFMLRRMQYQYLQAVLFHHISTAVLKHA